MYREELKVSSIEEVCEFYFDNVKPKHLKEFDEVTPSGNHITGYICHKPNKYLGSMLILSVNDEPTEQFIQSMPKIHYHKDERDINRDTIADCYEKLDGSCIILYPLKDYNNEIIEIVPKTRGRPVADNHFIELLDKIDKKPILCYYSENEGNLIFELYGILNQHEIIHYDTGLDMKLIGIYDCNNFINSPEIVNEYGFNLPDKLFSISYHPDLEDKWELKVTSEKYKLYLPVNPLYYATNTDVVFAIKELLGELNKEFYELNGRIATEGVVINTIREDGSKKWLKCKPEDIEIKHKTVNGIPSRSIRKEVYKYFDEYGVEVEDIFREDPNHHTEYLYRQLSEEYNDELIFRSKKKIENIFMEIWDAKQVPESLHNIAEDLVNEYGSEGIGECMRKFAEKYPMKKKDSGTVYGVVKKLFVKNNLEL